MSAFGTKPPVDPIWRHKPSTPSARLTILADRARQALARDMTLQELAVAISATESEAKDAAQAIGAACFWPSRGWRLRLRSTREHRLRAANDNRPAASFWAA